MIKNLFFPLRRRQKFSWYKHVPTNNKAFSKIHSLDVEKGNGGIVSPYCGILRER